MTEIKDTEEFQITIEFTTNLPAEYQLNNNQRLLNVSSNIKRLGLSQVINHYLELEPKKPFDFIVGGKLLRKSLKEHLKTHNISVESAIEVEYIPILAPPKTKNSAVHNDWVSSVDYSDKDEIISASYDGTVKAWNRKLDNKWTIVAHESPISSVLNIKDKKNILTCSHDHSIKLWKVDKMKTEEVNPSIIYQGHTGIVTSISYNSELEKFASSGWDAYIKIWDLNETNNSTLIMNEEESENNKKRRKLEENKNIIIAEALQEITSNSGCISQIIWPMKKTLFSGGWDHTVKSWDINKNQCINSYKSNKVINSISIEPEKMNVIAFGSTDPNLRLWDQREKILALCLKVCKSHTHWISSVKWSNVSDYHIATASFDHNIKIWDIRSNIPLSSIESHTDKVLTIDWSESWSFVSGSVDCTLKLHNFDVAKN